MMGITRRGLTLGSMAAIGSLAAPNLSRARTLSDKVKVGVLTDMSGFAADANGMGSVVAARLAVEDFAPKLPGMSIELIFADHQNKPDIGGAVARRWVDTDGVNVILDVPISSVALAVAEVTRNVNALFIASGAGSTELTGSKCSPHLVHWTYDTYALARGTAKAVTERGRKKWFFLTADYAFGHALERDASDLVKASGGEVVGSVRHPINTADFSSFLLRAQSSKADVIALANAVGDTINSIKQASEFGILGSKQAVVALLLQLTDVHSIGLDVAKGLYLTQPFYWRHNADTIRFSDRFAAQMGGRRPTDVQAGVYASLIHYLKAVEATKSVNADLVVAKMKEIPTDDPLFGRGRIRRDGRKIHDMHVLQVKSPQESERPWDYFKLINSIPAEDAFRPEGLGGCSLVKG